MPDTVAGYSVSVGERNSAPLYFTGAPRFEHIGQVVLFKHNGEKWTAFHRENGEQVGDCVEKVFFLSLYIHILNRNTLFKVALRMLLQYQHV